MCGGFMFGEREENVWTCGIGKWVGWSRRDQWERLMFVTLSTFNERV